MAISKEDVQGPVPAGATLTPGQLSFLQTVFSNMKSKPEVDVDWTLVAKQTNYSSGPIARIRFNTIIRVISGATPESTPKSSPSKPKVPKTSKASKIPKLAKTPKSPKSARNRTPPQDRCISPAKITKSGRGKKNITSTKEEDPLARMLSDASDYQILDFEKPEPIEEDKRPSTPLPITSMRTSKTLANKAIKDIKSEPESDYEFVEFVPVVEKSVKEEVVDIEEPMEDMFSDSLEMMNSSSDEASV